MAPSNPLNNDASSYIGLLLDVIMAQDWSTFESVGLQNPRAFKYIATQISQCPDFNGMTLLHACARFNPPAKIVHKMISLCPEMVTSRDCLDRTPLHVAAGTNARAEIVRMLSKAYPEACDIQDADGRTPLHFACDNSCELFEDDEEEEDEKKDSKDSPRQVSFDVVRALLSASLDAATIEDDDGMSPLEYAICSDASMEVVGLLQKATTKQMQLQTCDLPLVERRKVCAFSA